MDYVLSMPPLRLHADVASWRYRLYAFPRLADPSPADLIILDSGAFVLGQQCRHMSRKYLVALANYYEKHLRAAAPKALEAVRKASDSDAIAESHEIIPPPVLTTLCVAPDALFEPERTMRQWRIWYDELPARRGGKRSPRVYPVIQMRRREQIDLYTAARQAQFYGRHDVVFFSNPFLTASQAKRACVRELFAVLREYTRCRRLHVLGAGWTPEDVAGWRELGADSIDSIAWYTDAQAGKVWHLDGSIRFLPSMPLDERLTQNALVAAHFASCD